jgi:hypothetical protein
MIWCSVIWKSKKGRKHMTSHDQIRTLFGSVPINPDYEKMKTTALLMEARRVPIKADGALCKVAIFLSYLRPSSGIIIHCALSKILFGDYVASMPGFHQISTTSLLQ